MRRTLKYVYVLDGDLIRHGIHFEFQSIVGHVVLFRLRFLRVRI